MGVLALEVSLRRVGVGLAVAPLALLEACPLPLGRDPSQSRRAAVQADHQLSAQTPSWEVLAWASSQSRQTTSSAWTRTATRTQRRSSTRSPARSRSPGPSRPTRSGTSVCCGSPSCTLPAGACGRSSPAAATAPGSATFLLAHGEWVVEIERPVRPARRNGAKSDELDAIRAAREALARDHLAQPRRRGDREAVRVLLVTRRGAMRARTKAINHLKALVVTAREELRHQLRRHDTDELVDPVRAAANAPLSIRPSTARPSSRCATPPGGS